MTLITPGGTPEAGPSGPDDERVEGIAPENGSIPEGPGKLTPDDAHLGPTSQDPETVRASLFTGGPALDDRQRGYPQPAAGQWTPTRGDHRTLYPQPVGEVVTPQPERRGLSRRGFLLIGGGAVLAAAAAGTGAWLGAKGNGNEQTGTGEGSGTGNTIKKGYQPGNLDPATAAYHPPIGDPSAFFGVWQNGDIAIPKLWGPEGHSPNEMAGGVLLQMAYLISAPQPPGSQAPAYFSDNNSVSDFHGFQVWFRHKNPTLPDQLEFYDTADSPVQFGEDGLDQNGYPRIRLITGTLLAQRVHGGSWQTQEGRNPAKAQAIKDFWFSYKPSLDGRTMSVQDYAVTPATAADLPSFLEGLPA